MVLALQKASDLVTEDVLSAAVSGIYCTPAVLAALLCCQSLNQIPLTAKVMAKVRLPETLTALLRYIPRDFKITESMVEAVVRNESSAGQKIRILLDFREKDLAITEGIIEAALETYYGASVLRLLLRRRGCDFPVTNSIVTRIAQKYEEEVMTLLLEQREEEISITSAMLEAAVCNADHGPEMLGVLLSWSPETPVTENLMVMAGGSNSGPRFMRVILDNYGEDAPVTNEVLAAIVMADSSGEATMEVLVERRGQDVAPTEGVVTQAFRYSDLEGQNVLTALLRGLGQQSQAQITEEAIVALSRYFGPEEMTLCLNACGNNVTITAEMIDAAAEISRYGQGIIKVLLNHSSSDSISPVHSTE